MMTASFQTTISTTNAAIGASAFSHVALRADRFLAGGRGADTPTDGVALRVRSSVPTMRRTARYGEPRRGQKKSRRPQSSGHACERQPKGSAEESQWSRIFPANATGQT